MGRQVNSLVNTVGEWTHTHTHCFTHTHTHSEICKQWAVGYWLCFTKFPKQCLH